jgi:pyruvate dehydrogenase E1 component alpha subunit
MVRVKKLADRAAAYGIPGLTVDGNDVLAVYAAACEAIDRARHGEGPTLLECMSYRITGHSRRDPCNYQPEEERKGAIENEPIRRFHSYLLAERMASEDDLVRVDRDIEAEIEGAVKSAMAAPDPAPEQALEDLFV